MSSLDASVELLGADRRQSLLTSSCPSVLLDHFRIPYAVQDGLAEGEVKWLQGAGPALLWSEPGSEPATAATVLGADGVTEVPLFARLLPDATVQLLLAEQGGAWERARELRGPDGNDLGAIWRGEDGRVFLPFDPDEVILNYWSERYLRIADGSKARARRRKLMLGYYRARPLVPRALQIWLRRRFARLQARSLFPRWPVETGLHDFFELMLAILAGVAGEPVPCIAPWPDGHSWALVLTHDVEQAKGMAAIEPVLELERAHGLRSSWNFVPRRYEIDLERVRQLDSEGFEVGVHGLQHDGRDLESLATWQQRLPDADEAARSWHAKGFRSAALHREWEWMRLLAFEYDSSSPDTDPFEPQNGGCCTWLPFFNGGLVELPVTLPQDHTLFVILRQRDESAWTDKAEFLRERGGLALIDTHPDYLVDQHIFGAYARFLERFAGDAGAWKALPREVSGWWLRRAASSLERDGESWRIVGPAAGEARIELREGSW